MPQKAGATRRVGELSKCRPGRRLALTSLAVAAANPRGDSGGRGSEIEKGLGRWPLDSDDPFLVDA